MPIRIFLLFLSFLGLPVAIYLKNNFVSLFNEDSFGIKHFIEKAKEEAAKPKDKRMTFEEWQLFIQNRNIKEPTLEKPGNKLGQDL